MFIYVVLWLNLTISHPYHGIGGRLDINDLTYKVRGAIFEVNSILGHGFLEKVYEKALMVELRLRGIKAESQVPVEVIYKGEEVGERRVSR